MSWSTTTTTARTSEVKHQEQHIYLDDFNNSDKVNILQFPGGEFHPTIDFIGSNVTKIVIHTRLKNGDALTRLLTVTNAIKNLGIRNISVVIPYLPGCQQDRICNKGEALTCKVYADLINTQFYDKVSILDPHSDIAPALIDNCSILSVATILKQILQDYDTILVPDAGATKKLHSYYLKDISWDGNIVQCLKTRDTKTGELSGFEVVDYGDSYSNYIITDKKCIILDDLCIGGATFVGLGEEILKYNPKKLSLYVTHGIFSNGINGLFQTFDNIFTTDSWKTVKEYEREFATRQGNEDFLLPNQKEYNGNYDNFKVFEL